MQNLVIFNFLVLSTIAGFPSDNCWSCKFGKWRPFRSRPRATVCNGGSCVPQYYAGQPACNGSSCALQYYAARPSYYYQNAYQQAPVQYYPAQHSYYQSYSYNYPQQIASVNPVSYPQAQPSSQSALASTAVTSDQNNRPSPPAGQTPQ